MGKYNLSLNLNSAPHCKSGTQRGRKKAVKLIKSLASDKVGNNLHFLTFLPSYKETPVECVHLNPSA